MGSTPRQARPRRQRIGGAVWITPEQSGRLCKLCRQRPPKYTCPTCQLEYCGLDCFKSLAHSSCSEHFFRNALLQDIKSDPANTHQSRRDMLEMLRRLEAEEPQPLREDPGDSSPPDGPLTIQDLDLLTTEQLLDILSPEQAEHFRSNLVNHAFDSKFIEETILSHFQDPWWIPSTERGVSECHPRMIPTELLPPRSQRADSSLPYHVLLLILEYALVIRRYGLCALQSARDDREQILLSMTQLFPILFSDSVRPTSISQCFGLLLGQYPEVDSSTIVPLLMKDMRLLFPRAVLAKVSELKPHPTLDDVPKYQKALSDIYSLLIVEGKASKTRKRAVMKLLFFISFANDPPNLDNLIKGLHQEKDHAEVREQASLDEDCPSLAKLLLEHEPEQDHRSPHTKMPKIVQL